MTNESTSRKFSPQVRERAVRMATEHRGDHTSQWASIVSISAKIGCTAQTLPNWVEQAERNQDMQNLRSISQVQWPRFSLRLGLLGRRTIA
jgi:transposase-like protein